MANPRPSVGNIFYRVGLSVGISTLQYLEFSLISSSVLFEDRLQHPSPVVPPAYLAVNACGG